MRVYKHIYLVFLILILQEFAIAQNQFMINSDVKIILKSDDSIISVVNEQAVITLNDNINEFTAKFSLVTLVNYLLPSDSLNTDKSRLKLTFRGKFPISNFVFYENRSDIRNYEMEGSLILNGVSNPFSLIFNVCTTENNVYLNPDLCMTYCYDYYPVRMYFIVTLNPADFGINNNPEIINKQIFIEVGNGIMNKIY